MKIFLLTILFAVTGFAGYAQIDTNIYGIALKNGTPTTGAMYFATINRVTGTVTNISTSSLATTTALAGSTVDPYRNVYYFVAGGKFVGVDMTSGNIVSNVTVTGTGIDNFREFVFSCGDSTIYGLGVKNGSPTTGAIYLAKINPSTGVVTNISAAPIASVYNILNATIDPYQHIYYFESAGKLMGVDMTTGNIVSNPIITGTGIDHFQNFTFNIQDSTIYGLATMSGTPTTGAVYLGKINVATGVVTNISGSALAHQYTQAGTTLDPVSKRYYFVSSGKFTGVDLLSGNIIDSPHVSNPNADNFTGFQYIKPCVYYKASNSLGVTATGHVPPVFTLHPNPANSTLTIVLPTGEQQYGIRIVNMLGQVVYHTTTGHGAATVQVDVSGMSRGMYMVQLSSGSEVYSKRVLLVAQ